MKKLWETIDGKLLKGLPNPANGYEQYVDIPEFTFMGVHDQPDFGHIRMWFHGEKTTIELKSLKEYLFQYRDTIISYERAINVMYKHLMDAYKPFRLRLEIQFRPRGGISSTMKADSDWAHMGGSDKLWQHHKE
jgi:7-cyano-7-deazaguanine reductase